MSLPHTSPPEPEPAFNPEQALRLRALREAHQIVAQCSGTTTTLGNVWSLARYILTGEDEDA